MADLELVTAPDLELMQSLAQRVTAIRSDQISAGALYGELAWVWGKEHAVYETAWWHRLWFAGADVVGWAWCFLPRQVRRSDGTVSDVTSTFLAYQVRPGHAELVDEVIDWYDAVGAGLERTVSPTSAEDVALRRWAAHGYESDVEALGEFGDWTQLNQRDLTDVEQPALPAGIRFRTADDARPEAVVRAHARDAPVGRAAHQATTGSLGRSSWRAAGRAPARRGFPAGNRIPAGRCP